MLPPGSPTPWGSLPLKGAAFYLPVLAAKRSTGLGAARRQNMLITLHPG